MHLQHPELSRIEGNFAARIAIERTKLLPELGLMDLRHCRICNIPVDRFAGT